MIVKNLIAALREDETVYVNDLGLFRKVFTRAHVEEKQVFPPRYSILLDTEEEGSGYAFILFVSKSENTRIVDADLAIRRWVEQVTEDLHKGHTVTVDGFGTFSLKKNKLEFTAAPEIPELNMEFEGLEPIDIQKYPKQKHPERTEVLPPVEEEPKPMDEPEHITEPDPDVEPEPVTETEPIGESKPIIETKPVAESDGRDATSCFSATDESESAPDTEPESVEEPESVPETKSETDEEPEPESEPIIEPDPDVEPEPVTEPEPIVEAEPLAESDGRDATSCVSATDESESAPDTEPESVEEPESVPETESETDEEPEPESKKHWGWIVFVVVLLAAIGVLGWFFKDNILDFYHQKFDRQTITDTTMMVKENPQPAVTDTVAETDTIGYVEEEPVTEEPATEAKPFDINNLEHIQYEKGKYYLVHGSFSQEADCARHIRSHHFETYAPMVLHQSGSSRMRVCLGVFNSETEATQFAESHNIKDAWTLK